MPALERVFYVSRVAEAAGPVNVQRLLNRLRMRNRRADITGMLVYSARHFAQVLEGAESVLERVIAEIARDPRHTGFTVVFRKPIVAREYADWSMGPIEGFGADEQIESMIDAPPADVAEAERFARRLFNPAF